MSSTGTHRYRLEIAVQRLHDLVQLSSSARVVFSARFLNFPEIFIRPQTAGGGGIAEPSPDSSRIVSLTYNVFHKAEFNLSDDECRQCFPADCRFSVFDEAHPDALMTWTCPCPLTTSEIAAAGWNHMSYTMRNAAGQAVGLASMSCRVVALDAIAPSGMPQAAKMATSSLTTSPAIAGGSITSRGGKPYVIRVVLDRYGNVKGNKIKKNSSLAVETPLSTTVSTMATNPVPQTGSGLVVQEKHCTASTGNEQTARRSRGTAKKKTFLYVLQYDVAYQIQSNCSTLYATLKREFASLNAVSVSEKAKPMTLKLDNVVQSISRLANIALQLVNQLVESAGETYTDITSDAKGRRNPINKLSEPREGSVAHFLVYQVLFQLQCLGTNLCHVTFAYQSALEVPLSTLHHQHYKFIHRLCGEVQELSKYINIIVQSTIDGSFGADPDPTYSSSFTSTRSKYTRLSSRSSSLSTHSTVESVHSIPAIAPSATAATSLVKTSIPPVAPQHNGVAPPGASYAPPLNVVGTSALSPSAPPQDLKTMDGSTSLLSTLQQPPRPINATTTITTTNGSPFPSPPISSITTQAYTGTTALTGLGTGIGTNTGTTALTSLGTGIGTNTGTTALTSLGTGIGSSTGTTALTGLGTGIGSSTGTTALTGLGTGIGSSTGTTALTGLGTGIGTNTGTTALTSLGTGIGTNTGTTALTSLGTGIGTNTGTTALTSLGTGIGSSTGTTALTDLGTGIGTNTGTTALTSLGTGIGTNTGTTALTGLGTGIGTNTSTGMVDLPTPPPPPPHLPPALPSPPIASVATAPPSPLGPPPGSALAYTPPPPPSLSSSASQMMPTLNTTLPTPPVESTLLKTALTPPALTQPTDSAHKLPVDQPPSQVSISPSNPPSLGVTLDAPVPPPVALSSSPISVPGSVPSLSSTLGSHIQVPSNSFTPSQSVPIPVPLPVHLSVPAVPIVR